MDQLICDYHQTYAFRIKTIKNLNYDLAQISNDSETMIVTIDGQNQVQLNRKVILAYSLKIQLQRLLEARTVERRNVYFRASDKLLYKNVIEVIDIIKGAGASSIIVMNEFQG